MFHLDIYIWNIKGRTEPAQLIYAWINVTTPQKTTLFLKIKTTFPIINKQQGIT